MFSGLKNILDRIGSPEMDWVQVEVTSHCNAGCIYCPNHLIGSRQHMPVSLFKRLLPYVAYTDLIYLQGWGEPLLHEGLFDMIKACKEKNRRVGFTTNGMLLNDAAIQRLVELELDILSVSFAGTRPATHNRIRKGTDFSKIVSNLQHLEKVKAQKGTSRPAVHIAYLMMKSNFDEISKVLALSKSVGAEEVVASNLTLIIRESLWPEALFNSPGKYSYYEEKLETLVSEAQGINLNFSYHSPRLSGKLKTCSENIEGSCVIGVEGDVCPCVFMLPTLMQRSAAGDDQHIRHIFQNRRVALAPMCFGNIGTKSLTQIWHRKDYTAFRQLPLTKNQKATIPVQKSFNCFTCHKGLNA